MQPSEIYARLSKVFAETFDRDVPLTPSTSARDVDGWDSFAHINLTLAIEGEFGIRFRTADLEKMQSVGDMVTFIKSHQGK